MVIADRRDRADDLLRQIEIAAFPIAARQILAAAIDRSVGLDHAGAADPDHRRDLQLVVRRPVEQFVQHRDQPRDRFVTVGLVVAMPPKIALPNLAGGKIGFLAELRQYDTGADVRPADINREQPVVPGQRP